VDATFELMHTYALNWSNHRSHNTNEQIWKWGVSRAGSEISDVMKVERGIKKRKASWDKE